MSPGHQRQPRAPYSYESPHRGFEKADISAAFLRWMSTRKRKAFSLKISPVDLAGRRTGAFAHVVNFMGPYRLFEPEAFFL